MYHQVQIFSYVVQKIILSVYRMCTVYYCKTQNTSIDCTHRGEGDVKSRLQSVCVWGGYTTLSQNCQLGDVIISSLAEGRYIIFLEYSVWMFSSRNVILS